MQCFAAGVCSCNGLLSNTNPLEQLVQTPCLVQLVQPLDWTYAKQVWSWIRRETWSVAIHACKLVLLWGTLRVSIFHCLRHVLVSICLWFCGLDSGMTGTMPTFWHYKVLTISVDQCTSFLLLAASRVLWPHWVLALVWDTLKVCNPFVKLSWPFTWDPQHFCNHSSCSCATGALTLAWFDCHCYRHGINHYRSPRVFGDFPASHVWLP